MKHLSATSLTIALVLAFVLVVLSTAEWVPLTLPVAMLIGLGVPAGILLYGHRTRLSETFCGQGDCPRSA
jgi:hypothetical protein